MQTQRHVCMVHSKKNVFWFVKNVPYIHTYLLKNKTICDHISMMVVCVGGYVTFLSHNDPMNFFPHASCSSSSFNGASPWKRVIIEANQAKSWAKKEKWLRNLIKSNLVDSDAWWRAHYEAWSFSNDTTVSRTRRKTWLGWQALSDTANLLITWKLEGAHAKKGD